MKIDFMSEKDYVRFMLAEAIDHCKNASRQMKQIEKIFDSTDMEISEMTFRVISSKNLTWIKKMIALLMIEAYILHGEEACKTYDDIMKTLNISQDVLENIFGSSAGNNYENSKWDIINNMGFFCIKIENDKGEKSLKLKIYPKYLTSDEQVLFDKLTGLEKEILMNAPLDKKAAMFAEIKEINERKSKFAELLKICYLPR